MPAKINLIKQRFGKLTVIEETQKRKNKSIVWKCKCDCGNIIEASTKELRSDGLISCAVCGKTRNPQFNIKENIIGKKFGHLTVLEKTTNSSSEGHLYKCQCDCPAHTIVLRSKKSLDRNINCSCGCAKLKYQIGDIINNKQIIDVQQNSSENGRHYYKVKCLLCGKEYQAMAQSLEASIGCGCQSSKGEFLISQILQVNNIPYISQYHPPIKDIPKIRYDFALLDNNDNVIRLIEFDGEQHYANNIKNTGWNTTDHFLKTSNNDILKNNISHQLGIPLIRIPYWERNRLTLDLILSDKYLIK